MDFYIKELRVTGNNVRPAVYTFSRGVNIIYGDSDSGKSYLLECISYMFGASKMRISSSSGYNAVQMIIETGEGIINIERRFDTKKDPVSIGTTDKRYTHFQCTGAKPEMLDTLWKELIGIGEYQTIVSNRYYERKQLSWNDISKFLLIKEDRISRSVSIIPSSTQVYSTLLFLLTGEDFAGMAVLESDSDRRLKAKGARSYIVKKREQLTKRQIELIQKLASDETAIVDTSWNDLMVRLSQKEKQLSASIEKSKRLHIDIDEAYKALSSRLLQKENHNLLQELYDAQKKRLVFSMEGQLLTLKHNGICVCPFCRQEVENNAVDLNVLKASQAELIDTEITIEQFEADTDELNKRIQELEISISSMEAECNVLDSKISSAYIPEVAEIKRQLALHEEVTCLRNELTLVNTELLNIQSDYDYYGDKPKCQVDKYKPKDEYPSEFFTDMSLRLQTLLTKCGITDTDKVYFERTTMDASMDFQDKSTFGEGFRAFQNTAVAFSLYKQLIEKGVHSPGVLFIDSPVQAMKEKDGSGLTAALLNYIIANSGSGQVIIIENKIPSGVNLSSITSYDLSNSGLLPDFKPPRKIRKEHIEPKDTSSEQTMIFEDNGELSQDK